MWFPLPDILLTNFMMAELLLTRQDELDTKVVDHTRGLRFVVLDEFHTYRGCRGDEGLPSRLTAMFKA